MTRGLGKFQLKGFEGLVEVHELIGWPNQAEPTRPWREAFAEALNNYEQRNLEFAGGQALAKQRWMIKFDLAGPTADKWPGVKVFDTTNPKGCRILHSLSAG